MAKPWASDFRRDYKMDMDGKAIDTITGSGRNALDRLFLDGTVQLKASIPPGVLLGMQMSSRMSVSLRTAPEWRDRCTHRAAETIP